MVRIQTDLPQFAGDAAYINLEIEALHRRARKMPDQTARHGSPADELVGQERMELTMPTARLRWPRIQSPIFNGDASRAPLPDRY